MHPVEWILALLAAAVGLALVSRVVKIPEPIFLVLGGVFIGLQP